LLRRFLTSLSPGLTFRMSELFSRLDAAAVPPGTGAQGADAKTAGNCRFPPF
jgi:hypothetical protein